MTVKKLRDLLFDVKNQDAVVKIDGLNILDVEASRFDPHVQLLNEKTHGQREARERRWAKDYLRESLKRAAPKKRHHEPESTSRRAVTLGPSHTAQDEIEKSDRFWAAYKWDSLVNG